MRIAFDIDETLIPYGQEFAVERPPLLRMLGFLFPEGVRVGTTALLRELSKRGWEIWIYTTSGRSPHYLTAMFLLLGVRLGGVVNCYRHEQTWRRQGATFPRCSKYPPAFGIDLLVDNSEGVLLEGQTHGFRVILVDPADPNWAERILQAVATFR